MGDMSTPTLIALCLSVTSEAIQSSLPYVVAVYMVRDFLGEAASEQLVGRYTGALTSFYFVGQFLTAYLWGNLSDRYGRKPVLVMSNISAVIMGTCYGLASSYPLAALSRFIPSLFSCTFGMVRCMMADTLDINTQAVRGGYVTVSFSMGTIMGPAIGGGLSSPCNWLPSTWFVCRPGGIFATKPYLLPCLVASCLSLVASVASLFLVSETRWAKSTEVALEAAATVRDEGIKEDGLAVETGDGTQGEGAQEWLEVGTPMGGFLVTASGLPLRHSTSRRSSFAPSARASMERPHAAGASNRRLSFTESVRQRIAELGEAGMAEASRPRPRAHRRSSVDGSLRSASSSASGAPRTPPIVPTGEPRTSGPPTPLSGADGPFRMSIDTHVPGSDDKTTPSGAAMSPPPRTQALTKGDESLNKQGGGDGAEGDGVGRTGNCGSLTPSIVVERVEPNLQRQSSALSLDIARSQSNRSLSPTPEVSFVTDSGAGAADRAQSASNLPPTPHLFLLGDAAEASRGTHVTGPPSGFAPLLPETTARENAERGPAGNGGSLVDVIRSPFAAFEENGATLQRLSGEISGSQTGHRVSDGSSGGAGLPPKGPPGEKAPLSPGKGWGFSARRKFGGIEEPLLGSDRVQDRDVEIGEGAPLLGLAKAQDGPVRWYQDRLLLLLMLGYGLVSLFSNISDEVVPLLSAAPRAAGGLSLTSSQLSVPTTISGAVLAVYALFGVAWAQRRFGARGCCLFGVVAYAVVAPLIPLVSLLPDNSQIVLVTMAVILSLRQLAAQNSFSGSMLMFISVAPVAEMGTVNGAAQTLASFMRAVGPALGGLTWAWCTHVPVPLHQALPFVMVSLGFMVTRCLYSNIEIPPQEETLQETASGLLQEFG